MITIVCFIKTFLNYYNFLLIDVNISELFPNSTCKKCPYTIIINIANHLDNLNEGSKHICCSLYH